MILTNLSCFISCKEIDSLPKSNPAIKTRGSMIKREITTILVLDFSLKMDIHLFSFYNFSVYKQFSKNYFVKKGKKIEPKNTKMMAETYGMEKEYFSFKFLSFILKCSLYQSSCSWNVAYLSSCIIFFSSRLGLSNIQPTPLPLYLTEHI